MMSRLARTLRVVFTVPLGGLAMPHIASASPAVADEPSQRLAALRDLVMGSNKRFSARATLAELDAIEQLVPADSVERGRAEQLKAIIAGKIDRPE